MQELCFYVNYHELSEHLAVSELGPSAAEAHGMLCAMLVYEERGRTVLTSGLVS